MKNIVKLAIGVAAVTAGTIVAGHMIKRCQERKYVTPDKYKATEETTNGETKTESEEDIPLKERLAAAATEKVMDILAWAGDHEKELKGLAIMLTVAGGAVDLALGLKKVGKRSKLFDEIHKLNGKVWATGYDAGWKASSDDIFNQLNYAASNNQTFKFVENMNGNKVTIGEWIVKGVQEVAA